MKSNVEIYEDVNRLLGINQTEFATRFCKRSESYIRVLRIDVDREMPTHVLINIWDELELIKALIPQTAKKGIGVLQEKIAKEIVYRNTKEQHRRLRKMIIKIVREIEEQQYPSAMPFYIL